MSKFKKIICYVLYKYLGVYLPKTKNKYDGLSESIRRVLVRGYIDSCGKKVNIQRKAIIARRVRIGDCSGIGEKCLVQGNVKIGNHVMMGPEVIIYTQNHRFDRIDITMDEQGFSDEKAVIIEDDVWIGARVIILPGVTIGKGSVIGAGSVVTKTIPEYSIAVGNPAVVKKNRTSVR